jgi:predicted CXXCH cytochrome family protein
MSHPMSKVPAAYTIPAGWPLTDGATTCLTCHFAGHVSGAVPGRPDEPADAPKMLRGGVAGDRTAVCFRCHDHQRWSGRNPHQESARKTDCTHCHVKEPVWGGDPASNLAFIADINILCLACHDVEDHPGGVRHTMTLAPGMTEPPALFPLGTGRRITCGTCHDTHVDLPAEHLLRGSKEPVAFCARCHKL